MYIDLEDQSIYKNEVLYECLIIYINIYNSYVLFLSICSDRAHFRRNRDLY